MHYTQPETTVKVFALTAIDGIIGALTRGGPGREVLVDGAKCTAISGFIQRYSASLGATKTSNGWKLEGDSVFEALYLARATYEVLMDSCPTFARFPMEDQLSLFNQLRTWPRSHFTKWAKFMTAWPMARFLKNEVPALPTGFHGHPLVFKGKIKRFLKNRLVSFNDRNARLWAGYLQGIKRGAAPCSPDFVKESLLKHRAALSMPSKATSSDIQHFAPYFKRFFRKFRPADPSLLEASTSAAFESKRSEGGARGYIREMYGGPLGDHSLLEMIETAPGVVRSVYGLPMPSLEDVLADAETSHRRVMAAGILEPLKVRLITKGSPLRYWFARFYQKSLWKYLQKFPQFSPTGRPLCPTDFHALLARERSAGIIDFEDWVSGDYSAATDNLDIAFTRGAFEASLAQAPFSNRVKEIVRSVIYEQEIHYPKSMNVNGDLDPVMQTTGQLMGSVLSFPILCCVNVVAYWAALEDYLGRSIHLEDLPVIVNGDDILFRTNSAFYKLWQEYVARVGFTLSLGKNYVHKQILTINSQIFRHIPEFNHFKKLNYYNTGLLTGQSKVTGREKVREAPLWSYYNEVVPNAVNPARAHKRFLHYHRKMIERLATAGKTTFNLFLPFHRGGLGFEAPSSIASPFRITSFQRRFATFMMSEMSQKIEEHEDPGAGPLGLIQIKPKSSGLNLHHVPLLRLDPLVGPLEKDVIIYLPKTYMPPALSQPVDPERPEMTIRFPKRSVMSKFRAGSWRRMSTKEISSWPFRLVEKLEIPATPIKYAPGFERMFEPEELALWD